MNNEDIKRYCDEAHQNAIDKGFYKCPECKGKKRFNFSDNEEPDLVDCPNCKGSGIDPNRKNTERNVKP